VIRPDSASLEPGVQRNRRVDFVLDRDRQIQVVNVTSRVYDRPGMRHGVRSDLPYVREKDDLRTADEAVAHLRGLLAEADLAPPYVLVGHSLGGQYVLTFAKLHPDEVAGIVLVDSRPPNFATVCREVVANPVGECVPSDEQIQAWPPEVGAEMLGMLESEQRLPTGQQLPDVPITVITATEPSSADSSSRASQEAWINEQRKFAEGTPNARYVEAARTGHFVHAERPELVIAEIRAVLGAARASADRN
jgi:pimeloyl-ACP methyl ester carboxylesterase